MAANVQEFRFEDIVQLMVTRWKLIFLPAVIASIIAAVISMIIPKTYESYAIIRVGFNGNKPLETVDSIREIMTSFQVAAEIAKIVGIPADINRIEAIRHCMDFEDIAGIVKITAQAGKPEDSKKIVDAITQIVIARHKNMYNKAKEELVRMLDDAKKVVNPVLLAVAFGELRVEETTIEIPSFINDRPVKPRKKLIVMVVFFTIFLFNFIIATYLESRGN